MGRVAKYKKTKSSLKEYKGGEYVWGTQTISKSKKRSQTAEKHLKKKLKRRDTENDGFNLPGGKDEFDLSDFVVKKQKLKKPGEELATPPMQQVTVAPSHGFSTKITNKVKIGGKLVSCSIPQNERDEKKLARSLNIDTKTGKSTNKAKKEASIEGRRQGESMNAFHKRLKLETQMALADDFNRKKRKEVSEDSDTITKSQRRKEYMKKKKLKKNAPIHISHKEENLPAREESEDNFITGEQAAKQISFLEQAERPPIFNQLPRGAKSKSKLKMKGVDSNGNKMDKVKIKAEQDAMEAMKRKVQAQYAILKAKRKQGGNFHL